MLDFKRIGGEIISSPLNENFRQLRNEISIANTNLIFSETDGVKDTIADMLAIENPDNAQVCYVISSGELYRYAAGEDKWHKIADFGQTFRQGFLNSGAVILESSIKLQGKSTLELPDMLLYFKNQEGDTRYLKGMYLIKANTIQLKDYPIVSGANTYSLFVDSEGSYTIEVGIPKKDDVNKIYIGSFITDANNEIIGEDFIYTMPDMAYTADRSKFLFEGGIASGLKIRGGEGTSFTRDSGYYYDEGINYIIGNTEDYPVNSDNGTNYNLKYFESENIPQKVYYLIPSEGLEYGFEKANGLIYDKYWDSTAKTLKNVDKGYYTIQHHLFTPTGQNIIIYGSVLYNSLALATSALNSAPSFNFDFPYVEISRLIIGNPSEGEFSANKEEIFVVHSLDTLARVGTISPEFADNLFKIYSGIGADTSPSSMRFVLDDLVDADISLYNLRLLPYNYEIEYFVNPSKYVGEGIDDIKINNKVNGVRGAKDLDGYYLADNADIEVLRDRIRDIETEIWALEDKSTEDIYKQSLRYRLFSLETRVSKNEEDISQHGTRITQTENNKVNKTTTINKYTLGDTADSTEAKSIVLKTGDIEEGLGKGTVAHEWFTQDKVSSNTDVKNATAHINTISVSDNAATHKAVNPHNLATDDLVYLTDTNKLFVSVEEERRIRADRLPDNTIQALADLDAKNIDSVKIDTIDGASWQTTGTITPVGEVTGIRFYEHGTNLELSEDGKTLVVECIGQADEDLVMMRQRYATKEMADPTNPELQYTVDRAVTAIAANAIHGIASAGPDKYYGTDKDGQPGIHDIQKFITTADADSFTSLDQVAFVPVQGSVVEEHLSTDLANKINNNYHEIYNTGTLKSAQINKFNFGDNLTVTINGDTATINATGELSGVGVLNFANLADVDVTYTGNKGRMLVVNEEENGLVVSNALSLDEYMLETVYVDPDDVTKIKKAKHADNATIAETSNNALLVNNKSVDDNKTNNTVLWTAAKIISNTSSQIQNEGVNTYSGTTVPSDSLGKNGDLYILIEG